jgi:hypothetical protein
MNYSQQLTAALVELDQLTAQMNANQSRREVFRKIAARQQLDTIAIALTTRN